MTTARPLGIDVGGSGIKGAPVDLDKGEFAQERFKIDTPAESTPEAVCDVIAQIVDRFDEVHDGSPIGVTVPGVVQHGVVKTAANIDKSWIGCEIEKLLEDRLQHDVVVVNDADAAGVGELHYGAAKGQDGLVILTTLGTGIGTAVINRGVLVPNSELGHLEIGGVDAETVTASSAKTREDLSYEEWAKRLQRYYRHLEDLHVARPLRRRRRGVAQVATSSCRCSTSAPRSCRPRSRTPPASSVRRCSPPRPRTIARPAQGLRRAPASLAGAELRRGRRRRGRGCGWSATRAGRPGRGTGRARAAGAARRAPGTACGAASRRRNAVMSRLRCHGAWSGNASTSTVTGLGVEGVAGVEERRLALGVEAHPDVGDARDVVVDEGVLLGRTASR